jgi:replication-associated recombination protein RarA
MIITRLLTSATYHFVSQFLFKRLEDLVAQDDIVSILTNLIDSDNLPHLLLYGPPGMIQINE